MSYYNRGGYDLNGRYYSNADDAMNAEIAQCNEIDNRHNQRRLDHYQQDLQRNAELYSQYMEDMDRRLRYLEEPLLHYRDEMIKHNQE